MFEMLLVLLFLVLTSLGCICLDDVHNFCGDGVATEGVATTGHSTGDFVGVSAIFEVATSITPSKPFSLSIRTNSSVDRIFMQEIFATSSHYYSLKLLIQKSS